MFEWNQSKTCWLVYLIPYSSLFSLQPAKEEKVEDTKEKSPEKTKEAAEGEEAEREEKKKESEGHVEAETDGGESQISIFQSPLRLVRKNKMKVVVCHVTLLDGTDFTCEVEVRRHWTSYINQCRFVPSKVSTHGCCCVSDVIANRIRCGVCLWRKKLQGLNFLP